MITEGLDKAVRHVLEDIFCEGEITDQDNVTARIKTMDETVAIHHKEMMSLIRAEAINLADRIIGKDKLLHGDQKQLNPVDKAVFDHQVAQRVLLAEYQNPAPKGKPTGPEDLINPELSEGEA